MTELVQFTFNIITSILLIISVYFIRRTKRFEDTPSYFAMLAISQGLIFLAVGSVGQAIQQLYKFGLSENAGLVLTSGIGEFGNSFSVVFGIAAATCFLMAAIMLLKLSKVFKFMK